MSIIENYLKGVEQQCVLTNAQLKNSLITMPFSSILPSIGSLKDVFHAQEKLRERLQSLRSNIEGIGAEELSNSNAEELMLSQIMQWLALSEHSNK